MPFRTSRPLAKPVAELADCQRTESENQGLREPITYPTTMSKKLCHILFMKHTRGRNDDDDDEKEEEAAS